MIIIIILVDRETGKASTQILWFPVKSVKNRIQQTYRCPKGPNREVRCKSGAVPPL